MQVQTMEDGDTVSEELVECKKPMTKIQVETRQATQLEIQE